MTKTTFHKQCKTILRKLAKELGLERGAYEVRSCLGGPAVMGEVILHTDSLYVVLSEYPLVGGVQTMWRTCNGRKDYTGGRNVWEKHDVLKDIPAFAARLKKVQTHDKK